MTSLARRGAEALVELTFVLQPDHGPILESIRSNDRTEPRAVVRPMIAALIGGDPFRRKSPCEAKGVSILTN